MVFDQRGTGVGRDRGGESQGAWGCSSSCKYRGFFPNLEPAGWSGRNTERIPSRDVRIAAADFSKIVLLVFLVSFWQLFHGRVLRGEDLDPGPGRGSYNSSERMTWKRVTL
jgi:hypothetical protein